MVYVVFVGPCVVLQDVFVGRIHFMRLQQETFGVSGAAYVRGANKIAFFFFGIYSTAHTYSGLRG